MVFQVIAGRAGKTVLATRAEIVHARLRINPVARAVAGLRADTGAPLPGVDPEVEV